MLYMVEVLPSYLLLCSLEPRLVNVLCLAYYILLFCIAIATPAPFEGMTTFDPYRGSVATAKPTSSTVS